MAKHDAFSVNGENAVSTAYGDWKCKNVRGPSSLLFTKTNLVTSCDSCSLFFHLLFSLSLSVDEASIIHVKVEKDRVTLRTFVRRSRRHISIVINEICIDSRPHCRGKIETEKNMEFEKKNVGDST